MIHPFAKFTAWLYSLVMNFIQFFPTLTGFTLIGVTAFAYRIISALLGLSVYKITGMSQMIPDLQTWFSDHVASISPTITYMYQASGVADGMQIFFLFLVLGFSVRLFGTAGTLILTRFNPFTFGT